MLETIFAQATAPGRAGLAVIRISGPAAHAAAIQLSGKPVPPRAASLRMLRDPGSGEVIDEVLLVHFPEPGSYTGETVVEIQCHGSPAVCRRLLHVLADLEGLRAAEPGEFTRRALENGRLDLAQVEGLADLLAAETEAQRRQALAVASGALSGKVERWRGELLDALALVEAIIDFGDDGVPEAALEPVPDGLRQVASEMDAMLAGSTAAERIRDGFTVAICGEPNVGKSTLLNAIAGREVALISEFAGTTRDVLEVHVDLGGLPVTFLDTAGLRETEDLVERLGIERARARAGAADLRILLCEGELDANENQVQEGDILVRAKVDLAADASAAGVSGLSGRGIGQLLDQITRELQSKASSASGLAQQRQRQAVVDARGGLGRCLEFVGSPEDALELAAFELRTAVRALDALTGRVDVEAVLDRIFGSFCLGK